MTANNTNIVNDGWRKAAASKLTEDEVELSFMRQAFAFVEDKAKPLIRDPYFLGFEVVDMNDAKTNIVGLFVFRVDKHLLYAPAFFKNGEIRGIQHLYDATAKLFVPLVEKWCNYYVGKYDKNEGRLVDKQKVRNSTGGINFDQLKHPRGFGKNASAQTLEDWEEMKKRAGKSGERLLSGFLDKTGFDGFQKLASTIESDYEFADHIVETYELAEWLDRDFKTPGEDGIEKGAARTEPGVRLVLHSGKFNPHADVSAEEQFIYGYSFTDTRSPKTEIYENPSDTGESILEPGFYRVMEHDGGNRLLYVVPGPEYPSGLSSSPCENFGGGDKGFPYSSNTLTEAGWNPDYSYKKKDCVSRDYKVFDPVEKKCGTLHEKCLYGIPDEQIREDGAPFVSCDALEKGKHYTYADGRCVAPEPFEVVKRETEENIATIHIKFPDGGEDRITVNKDLDTPDTELGVLSGNAMFFKNVPPEEGAYFYENLEFRPGNFDTITDFLRGNGVKKASVRKDGDGRFVIFSDLGSSFGMDKRAAAASLAHGFGIDGNKARDLVEEADGTGKREFLMLKSGRPFLVDYPDLREVSTNSEFGVREDTPESYVITTENDNPEYVGPETGDQYRMGNQATPGPAETATPKELYEVSKSIKDDSVFDLGVVGSLVGTFDSVELIDSYMPDLRQGLDRIGRILFLIYWKPEDFGEIYGTEDIDSIENKLLSTFKQYGDLVLELMQKFRFEDEIDLNSMGK